MIAKVSRNELDFCPGVMLLNCSNLGPDRDFPAADVYTRADEAWIMDLFRWCAAQELVVRASPISLGGSQGRAEATARGCLYALREACLVKGVDFKGSRVAIHGFGNAGANISHMVAADGARVVAICDSKVGLYSESGIDIQEALRHKKQTSSLQGMKGVKEIAATRFDSRCDILASALEMQSRSQRWSGQTKYCRAGQWANYSRPDRIFADEGVFLIPDILANAGGVTVSYTSGCRISIPSSVGEADQ